MKFHELSAKAKVSKRRIGRGISAGRGKTAGRGTKGQGSRKSGGVRPGFEGGQMPVYMRLPKLRGFKSLSSKAEIIYTGQLEKLNKTIIDNESLHEAGLLSSPHSKAKLIVKGSLSAKKDVKLQVASSSAIEMLQKAGGSFTKVDQVPRPKQQNADSKKQ